MESGRKVYLFFLVPIISVIFLILIVRLYYLQILLHEERMKQIENSFEFTTVRGRRGTIYDKNKTPLAISQPKIDIAVDPKGVVDKVFIAELISKTIGTDRSKTLEILRNDTIKRKKDGKIVPKHFEVLKADAPYEDVAAIKNAVQEARDREFKKSKSIKDSSSEEKKKAEQRVNDLAQITYKEGFKRVYPQGRMLSNVLGFIQKNKAPDEDGPEGLEGIELMYDDQLAGQKKQVKTSRLTKRRVYDDEIDVESEIGDSIKGSDIYLTIDSEIQFIAEEELAKMVDKVQAKWGGVVIMDPASGHILAMANYPGYEPEQYWKYPAEDKRNHAVNDLFEPGSTFKSFSILAVLNENLAKPGEQVSGENGAYRFGKRIVHDSHPCGLMTIRDVVVNSSNIGTIKFADRLSSEQLYNYFTMFGFGQKSGINIPGEAKGKLKNYTTWYPIDKGNLSFGQGLSVNMVQMARAYSAIYNGGVLWKPVLVDKIVGKNDEQIFSPEPKRINFKYKSDKQIIDMLEGVVSDEHGTAKKARIKGVAVGGKTGTSQIYDKNLKKYSSSKSVCSFAGAVPNNNPKFVMIVVINEPKGREFGGTVAAPVFREIASRILPKFDVFVDRNDKDKDKVPEYVATDMTGSVIDFSESEVASSGESDYVKVPDFVKMMPSDAIRIAHGRNLDVVFVGNPSNGKNIIGQSPKSGETVLAGTGVTLYIEEGENENN